MSSMSPVAMMIPSVKIRFGLADLLTIAKTSHQSIEGRGFVAVECPKRPPSEQGLGVLRRDDDDIARVVSDRVSRRDEAGG